jgi:hypothetical protein
VDVEVYTRMLEICVKEAEGIAHGQNPQGRQGGSGTGKFLC